MHRLETSHYLNENAPNFLLSEGSLVLLMLGYLLEKIPIVRVFHHNTKKVDKYIFLHPYHKDCEAASIKASLYCTMWLLFSDARIRTSLMAFSFSLSER
jgi:hypothetical protein